jgi:protein-tyrosine phosphatase
MASRKSILFVCLGNICRSPACEGICKSVVGGSILVDSAGTGGWHTGSPHDSRSIKACRDRGIDISQQRARQLTSADFTKFTVIAALDHDILRSCQLRQPSGSTAKIVLFNEPDGIDDPYYGEDKGFAVMFDNIFNALRPFLTAQGLL